MKWFMILAVVVMSTTLAHGLAYVSLYEVGEVAPGLTGYDVVANSGNPDHLLNVFSFSITGIHQVWDYFGDESPFEGGSGLWAEQWNPLDSHLAYESSDFVAIAGGTGETNDLTNPAGLDLSHPLYGEVPAGKAGMGGLYVDGAALKPAEKAREITLAYVVIPDGYVSHARLEGIVTYAGGPLEEITYPLTWWGGEHQRYSAGETIYRVIRDPASEPGLERYRLLADTGDPTKDIDTLNFVIEGAHQVFDGEGGDSPYERPVAGDDLFNADWSDLDTHLYFDPSSLTATGDGISETSDLSNPTGRTWSGAALPGQAGIGDLVAECTLHPAYAMSGIWLADIVVPAGETAWFRGYVTGDGLSAEYIEFAIPEPGTLALLAAAGLAVSRRRMCR